MNQETKYVCIGNSKNAPYHAIILSKARSQTAVTPTSGKAEANKTEAAIG